MNCIIPFTKDIKFNTNICEILSISLEHDYTVNDTELLGNFVVSGEYKSHEVSVNKENFEYVLPFSVTLAANVDKDTLDFNIEDFTYEVLENSVLKIDIEYSVKASEIVALKEEREVVPFEKVESEGDNTFEELLEEYDEKVEKVEEESKKEEIEVKEVEEEKIEKDDEVLEENRDIAENEKITILNSISEDDDTFVTYHIHVLKEQETIETVCTMYNTTSNVLNEYNDISNVVVGDKIIIPEEYE